ncbi:MAG: electron transfer flavoprotein subunit alpha [Porticoccus sp.]|jgi:electron transfer flavoprotein alpha subunit|nr:electron transfer flavoprotein subunit alpha [Porticoccus sp.]|tara:strand:+ start:1900 stop:2835 length:936 start_codon:yes stop_codon:yes gene_type:complete
MNILVISEHDNNDIKESTMHAITAARELGNSIDLLVTGLNCGSAGSNASKIEGVARVIVADCVAYENQLAENIAPIIQKIAAEYSYILMAATTTGKNIIPRAAALVDSQPISDVISIVNEDTFKRPIYAGNVIATIQSIDKIKFMTIRATAFEPASISTSSAPIESLEESFNLKKSEFVKNEISSSERPELTSARVVISGGRGMLNEENFKLLENLADKFGGAVGASRAAVDSGFAPNDMQVGQTGKIVAPDLYIAVGISGAIQHLAGMKDSKVIVAINKDPDAPIFQNADYGLVADLFEVVPELDQKLVI